MFIKYSITQMYWFNEIKLWLLVWIWNIRCRYRSMCIINNIIRLWYRWIITRWLLVWISFIIYIWIILCCMFKWWWIGLRMFRLWIKYIKLLMWKWNIFSIFRSMYLWGWILRKLFIKYNRYWFMLVWSIWWCNI